MDDRPRILIVDNQPDARDMLEAILPKEDYVLAFAESGPDALAQVQEFTPDAILLDVMMPGMDGFEVCRRLRADPLQGEVPIILVTALEDPRSRLRGIEAGADDFVSKPIDPVELQTQVRTITRLNRYRQLLRERSRRLEAEETILRDRTQAILEALGEAVVVTDVHGRVQYMNPAASKLTGYISEEIVGQACSEGARSLWQREILPDKLRVQMEELRQSGQKWSGEVVCRRKDGTLYDAAVTVAPIREPIDTGPIVGLVSVQRDITPIKEAERSKDRFISNVSHELRTPLSVLSLISGNLDLLYDGLSDDKRRQMIQDIRQHIQVLSGVIDAVLELSRIDSAQVSGTRERLNLVLLVTEEAEKQLPLAHGKSQSVIITGENELPVYGNEDQLRQVIRNLLNNAIKYTPEGGQIRCQCLRCEEAVVHEPAAWHSKQATYRTMTGMVQGTTEPSDLVSAGPNLPDGAHGGPWAALHVIDTGIGISAKDMPHLFERFYRVKTEDGVPGTGLGLSIASELIGLHDGQITVASNPGEGSVFTIFLPLLEDDS
jgi:PAS domain S-box-containing protein